jgi:hypothetical protein
LSSCPTDLMLMCPGPRGWQAWRGEEAFWLHPRPVPRVWLLAGGA